MLYKIDEYKTLHKTVQKVLSDHITQSISPQILFDFLLQNLLAITKSEYGFIGRIFKDEDKNKYLKTYALTNIAWDDTTREFHDKHAPHGLEFKSLDNLFGYVIKEEKTIIANDPSKHKESGGLPKGHPPLNAFLGVPFKYNDQIIGMFGIANKKEGYSTEDIEFLEPLVSACTTIIHSYIQAEEAKETEKMNELLIEIINNSKEAIQIAKEDGYFVFANNQALDRTGFTIDEFTAKKVMDLEGLFKTEQDWFDHVEELKAGDGIYLEGVHTNKQGIDYPVEVIVSYIKTKNDGYICAFTKDISERKKKEEELVLAHNETKKALSARTDFLSVMSHEIRTPLNAVVGISHLLSQEIQDPTLKGKLNTLQFSAKNLLSLINDILDFNKILSGNIEFERNSFSIKHILQETLHLHEASAKAKNIVLVLELDCDHDQLIGDQHRLTQIINNLLSNAIKFTQKGEVKIICKSSYTSETKRKFYFQVKDTGIGIPKKKLQHIFNAFTQASSSTTREYGGTGLGLSICKEIIELQHGIIGVNSQEDFGSNFFFNINYDLDTTPIEVKSSFTKANWKTANPNLASKSVLIVEDNPINHMITQNFLKIWGIESNWAKNGLECIDILNKENFDLILMDLQMPIMDGFEASKQIRESNSSYQNIPIIALTATTTENLTERFSSYDFLNVLPKPFEPQDLQEALIKAFELTE